MIGWLTTLLLIILTLGALWLLPRFSAGRRRAAHDEQLTEELSRLARSLRLEDRGKAQIYGDVVHRLEGYYNELGVDIEVCLGRELQYLRVTVEFPQTLDQDLTILNQRSGLVRRWFLRHQKVETGDEEFDEDFVLLARHPRRLNVVLSPSMRFQLQRLRDKVDALQVGDGSVFAQVRDIQDPENLARIIRKTLEVAERIYATAAQLGPSPSRRDATVYQQATTGIYGRVEEPTESSETDSSLEVSSSR
ncbi:MAG: hypothetical protein ACOCV2_07270 [Persicimonas sp.]